MNTNLAIEIIIMVRNSKEIALRRFAPIPHRIDDLKAYSNPLEINERMI
jgi:hypothetical protein